MDWIYLGHEFAETAEESIAAAQKTFKKMCEKKIAPYIIMPFNDGTVVDLREARTITLTKLQIKKLYEVTK